MAFRGRGRGRGYGRGGFGGFSRGKQEPFELFPNIENVLPDAKDVKEEIALVIWSSRLQKFWNSSPYYLKVEEPKEDESIEIGKSSDRGKQGNEQKDQLSDFIKCTVEYVPAELVQGSKRGPRHKVKWNQDPDLLKFDNLEKREQRSEDQDAKGVKEKKEDEDEEDDEEKIDEEDEDFSDDGDYNQNIDFDDDEDDFNMDDDNDDEGTY
ncbi:uncharacterized protein LOC130794655 [Actinidia eriantha]|uniref:uncharacterized protein LOC130794655 n=1 Tax=Actinidia eriantha TaxID=165200 RepID=UPI00258D194C|nr:uncharacterized protein LOC130794655 [Actinidia eriantha]